MLDKLLKQITKKKEILDKFRPLPSALVTNLDDWFKVELTYTSNAIEGNTLSRQETSLVVEKGLTVSGKTLKEHLEAINHAEALGFIKELAYKKPQKIIEKDLLQIHWLILKKIDDENAGRYRKIEIKIAGSDLKLPLAVKIPELMEDFFAWLRGKNSDHPVKIAADAHLKLVTIHPFTDGNGRTARLLMNLILIQNGYPPALIRKEDRQKYIESIAKAQIKKNLADYYQVIFQAADQALDIYLETINPPKPRLLKIGQLAKAAGESVPTIRFWTKEDLLKVSRYSVGGYQLYEPSQISQAKKIRKLQKEKRLKLTEIKEKLKS